MKLDEIRNPVSTLPGVGPAAAKLFANLNVFTVADLLKFYPRDYDDRTKTVTLSHFNTAKVHTAAQVTAHDWFGYGRMRTLKLFINDGTMEAQLVAFNRPFLEKMLPVGCIVSVTGTFAVKYGALQSTAFDVLKLADSGSLKDFTGKPLPDSGIIPVYPLTEGLNQKNVRKTVAAALSRYSSGIDDELPRDIIAKRSLLSKKDAIRFIHDPADITQMQSARHTLIYEELYHFEQTMAERAWRHKGALPSAIISSKEETAPQSNRPDASAFTASLSPRQKQLLDRLPFDLTGDQISVIFQMNSDIDMGYTERSKLIKGTWNAAAPVYTMARLLQGDVGSGKTLAAFFACLHVIDWGGQCALMAPTEILARQHAETAAHMLEPLGIHIAFLTGNIQAAGRAQLLKALKAGEIDIIIGTHALFSTNVQYKDLQLVIIDEQHRFGVMQRNAIVGKGLQVAAPDNGLQSVYVSPHLLMMSATPIPQTLALTAFGDLDISTIHTMPAGRKPIITYLIREGHEQNAYEAVRKQLKAGHQAYFVYPTIEGSDAQPKLTADEPPSPVKSAEEMFTVLAKKVYPEYLCALLHSRIDEDTQIKVLSEFKQGKVQVLAATTVVEVGVDVPNATCMVIEQADHFGLAQLHQLHGRVGRGTDQSFCFLIYSKDITETGIARMKALKESTDGFIIAEEDLKLRGPGELTGTLQAGNLTLGIADLSRDHDLLLQARTDAITYLQQHLIMQHKRLDGADVQDAASVK